MGADPIVSPHDHQAFCTNDAAEACSGLLHIKLYSELLTFHKSCLNDPVLVVGVSESYISFLNTNIEKEVERNMLHLWTFIGSIS